MIVMYTHTHQRQLASCTSMACKNKQYIMMMIAILQHKYAQFALLEFQTWTKCKMKQNVPVAVVPHWACSQVQQLSIIQLEK